MSKQNSSQMIKLTVLASLLIIGLSACSSSDTPPANPAYKRVARDREPIVSTWIQTQVYKQYFQDRRACILETLKDFRENHGNQPNYRAVLRNMGENDDPSLLGTPQTGGRSAAQVFTDNQYYNNVLFASCMNAAGWIRMPENLPVR